MPELTQSVVNLINEFAKLPGIGKKSAERLAYHVLRMHRAEALALADYLGHPDRGPRREAAAGRVEIGRKPGRQKVPRAQFAQAQPTNLPP